VYNGFLGTHRHTVDAKGRLVMPAKYRGRLAGGVVITHSPDRCLHVYTAEGFEAQHAELVSGSQRNLSFRLQSRGLMGLAEDQELDSAGRIMLPPGMRAAVGIERDVVIVGVGPYMEVWDARRWPEEEARAQAALRQYQDEPEEEEA